MADGRAHPRPQDPAGVLVIGHHRIRVVRGTPDHVELAALTAALFMLARASEVSGSGRPRSSRHRRAHWDRNLPSRLHHPAHSWRARPRSTFIH